jgi:hypothetical protein
MNKIVWAVSQGEYSDYSVHAIFTDEKAACKYCEYLNKNKMYYCGCSFFVEDFPLNPPDACIDLGLISFRIYLDLNGETLVESCSPLDMELEKEINTQRGKRFIVYVFANDAEHAVKIASERYTKYKTSPEYLAKHGK